MPYMLKVNCNPKITLKDYMDFFQCSIMTAVKLRKSDMHFLGKNEIRLTDFIKRNDYPPPSFQDKIKYQ